MKFILFSLILCSVTCRISAQNDTTVIYFDANEKLCSPERAVKYAVQVKDQDHWLRYVLDASDDKVMYSAYFTDSACTKYDGPYTVFYKSHKTNTQGRYYENKKVGLWRSWSEDNKLIDSAFYVDGFIHGIALKWNNEGIITDSLIFKKNGDGISKGFWPTKILSSTGTFKQGRKDGKWIYYSHDGNKCQEVNYIADSAASYICYDEQGNVQTDNCYYEKEATFSGGDGAWKNWLITKLLSAPMPNSYYQGLIYGKVYVLFVVDGSGNVTDVKVEKSLNPELDVIAVNIIRQSPKWEPAVQYNRKVKAYRKQPITFAKAQ